LKTGEASAAFPGFLFCHKNWNCESCSAILRIVFGLAGVGVVFYVDGVEHCCCGLMGFFVVGDLFFVLEAGAYVVQAF
jgi:hypothetical protein